MQDPSQGVAHSLQNHVHLISGHRFPLLPALNIEQAFRYLIDAPTIVKQTAPMAWTYVQSPQDGTVWLEWIPQRNGDYRFASDGYVWGDPEQGYHQEFGGYTIEWRMHTVGFRPNFDHTASHARTRYHFVAKNPGVNAAPPDPSLWIVHYHQTEQSRMIPCGQVPISMQVRQIMNERRYLEAQGRLERKDFMLHDREHWPTINVPNTAHMPQMQQQGMYANPVMQQQMNQQRYPAYPYPQAAGPPAKRPRLSGPNAVPGSSDGVHETSLEDEENTAIGDFFDHLTPREISMARYMQHHRWMEEVFSSPYASSQLVPPDLGLGLMGELKGLTEGILDPPAIEDIGEKTDRPRQPKEVPPFTNLKKEQVDEFSKRVAKHLEEGQAEIERIKREHAEKMAEWRKTKTLMQAEKRLRYATWEGHENAVPAFRLEVPPMNGHHEDGVPTETVEDVIRDVEASLGVRIRTHKDATMVSKGGLEKQEEQPGDEMAPDGGMDSEKEMSDFQPQDAMVSGASGGVAELQLNTDKKPASSEPVSTAHGLTTNLSANASQPTFQGGQSDGAQAQRMAESQPLSTDDITEQHTLEDMDDMDMADTSLMADIDMDTGIDFVEHPPEALEDETVISDDVPEPSVPQTTQPVHEHSQDTAVNLDALQTASPTTFGGTEAAQLTPPEAQQQAVITTTAEEGDIATALAIGADPVVPKDSEVSALAEESPMVGDDTGIADGADNSMFDDTFDDLANMDDGHNDDGLIDFDGGMGMEDSAFGDALHGMDTPDMRGEGAAGDDELPGGAAAHEGS